MVEMGSTKLIPLRIYLILAILLVAPSTISSAPSTEIVLTQLETFVFAKEQVKTFDYSLVLQRGRNVINGTFAYTSSMTKMSMRVRLDFEKPDRTRFQMLDFKTDLCKLLNGEMRKHKVVQMVLQQLAEQKQFFKKCPLEGNKTYDLIMFDVRAPQFPLPNLKLIVSIIIYDEDDIHKLTEFRLKGAIKRKV